MSDKKKIQLGMNPSTASHRLVKDLLWSFVSKQNCYRCDQEMSRDSFSIEHIEPWLDSDDPVGLYFNIDNISFSHLSCNSSAARKTKAECGNRGAYKSGCRCFKCKEWKSIQNKNAYCPAARSERYIKNNEYTRVTHSIQLP